jgi:hypothetical protein
MKPITDAGIPAFTPVALRARHDGWTPQKQIDLIKAIAITGCVAEACRQVKMSTTAAYTLYNRADAAELRQAWDAAVDQSTVRLTDAMMSRAIHGVAEPIFYKGEQVGERRRFNDRLGMWLLRHRAPDRYGAWRDKVQFRRDAPDAVARILQHALARLVNKLVDFATGRKAAAAPLIQTTRFVDDPEEEQRRAQDEETERRRRRDVEHHAWLQRLDAIERGLIDPNADVVATSATSGG